MGLTAAKPTGTRVWHKFDPDGGVNSAEISSVDQHIKPASAAQCIYTNIFFAYVTANRLIEVLQLQLKNVD